MLCLGLVMMAPCLREGRVLDFFSEELDFKASWNVRHCLSG
jgi:hypothetical protein